MSKLLDVAVKAALEAGKIQTAYCGKKFRIHMKGPNDLVTEVDWKCQERILKILQKSFPTHDYVAEERGAVRRESEFQWHIDPIDGTTNFAHGYPQFCVSIGLLRNGKREGGVVYHPLHKELYTAERKRGTRLNGKRVHVSKSTSLSKSILSTGFGYARETRRKNLHYFAKFLEITQSIRRGGSAAMDLAYVAVGRLDAYWDVSLSSWDMAAGALLVEEAGGRVSELDGGPLDISKPGLLATNRRLHPEMLGVLK